MIAEPQTRLQAKPLEAQDAEHLIDRLVETAKVDAVSGEPIERDGVTLITCSELGVGLGGGFGPVKLADAPKNTGATEGIGGGVVARGRPVAVIVMTPDGVKIKPIVNVTRVFLAQVAMMGIVFLLTSRVLRHSRRMQKMSLAKHRMRFIMAMRQERAHHAKPQAR